MRYTGTQLTKRRQTWHFGNAAATMPLLLYVLNASADDDAFCHNSRLQMLIAETDAIE